jgi:hypothetical protein
LNSHHRLNQLYYFNLQNQKYKNHKDHMKKFLLPTKAHAFNIFVWFLKKCSLWSCLENNDLLIGTSEMKLSQLQWILYLGINIWDNGTKCWCNYSKGNCLTLHLNPISLYRGNMLYWLYLWYPTSFILLKSNYLINQ